MRRRRTTDALSSRDRGVLELERKWGQSSAARPAKLAEAESALGLSPSGYMLVLKSLIDDPVAESVDPETIAHLKAARDGGETTFGPVRY